MYNKNQQQLNDLYMKQCFNLYPHTNMYPGFYASTLENGNANNTGFMRLNIVRQSDKAPVPNSTITIYVTDGMRRDVPIMHLITTINPIRIELPMAYELGTQIVGPEYGFSTYNLRVDAFGYFATNLYNIRLFPNTTSDYEINMIEVSQLGAVPDIEERIDIPPHPRDVIDGEAIN
ncbi:hypothetical protein J2Z76_002392 [Sedimentibacter acidaminivorans]|uniref:Uncharacterized protein n=1 Tax=Sedimentibacter acidaminivorans TaxID=913099 RepID=A0ABS4GFQ5_9FIRM|nr:hypothetical protein [Sedimentibacter acidaminivorans]MBP1926523.1 hypothetical protein [Sedimentibacter acidaminivorans]